MKRLCELVDLAINNENCVVFEVKDKARIDLIALGCFRGDEEMIRMTKGRTPEISIWYKNGSTYSYHFGEGSITLLSDNMQKQRGMVRECVLLDFGIVCDWSHMGNDKKYESLVKKTMNIKDMSDAERVVTLVSGGGWSGNIRVNEQTMELNVHVSDIPKWFEERGYQVEFEKDINQGLECGVVKGHCVPIKTPALNKQRTSDKIGKEFPVNSFVRKPSLEERMGAAKKTISKNVEITEITKDQANLIQGYMDTLADTNCPHLSESGFYFLNESGKYYLKEDGRFLGFDYGADYEGFVEEFDNLDECKAWLRCEFEIENIEKWRKGQEGKKIEVSRE